MALRRRFFHEVAQEWWNCLDLVFSSSFLFLLLCPVSPSHLAQVGLPTVYTANQAAVAFAIHEFANGLKIAIETIRYGGFYEGHRVRGSPYDDFAMAIDETAILAVPVLQNLIRACGIGGTAAAEI